jgi:LPS-assembly lipoprotein
MLSSVAIKPVDERVAQELRNELIFLYSGGAGEPSNPEYQMTLSVRGQSSRALREDLTNGISSQRYSAVATYTLTRVSTGEVVSTGKRRVTTFYDQNTQEFAKSRALRDAETRAAKQLAEIIRADTAAILSRES